MPRIRIDIPSHFNFRTTIPVRITDINYGGHVGNDALLSLIHEARIQYLQHLGMSEMSFAGKGLIMSDVGIEFKKELFYGQQVTVDITPGEFGKINFDLYYRLSVVHENDEAATPHIIALAKTGMICYDYESRKVSSVPDEAMRLLKGV